MKRLPILFSFVLFLGVCMSGTYWTMQFIKPPVRQVAMPKVPERNDVNPEAVMNLFGGHLSVAAASNFQLKGVVVAKNAKESVAILVADGKPAEAVRVDSEIIPGVTVKEVYRDHVMLSENGVMKRVDLPVEAPAHGDVPTLGATSPSPQPAQQIPQPPPQQIQPPLPPGAEAAIPPGQLPSQGRIGRSAARMRGNLPQQ